MSGPDGRTAIEKNAEKKRGGNGKKRNEIGKWRRKMSPLIPNDPPSLPPSNWDLAFSIIKNWWAEEDRAFEPAELATWAEKKWSGIQDWKMSALFEECWNICRRRQGPDVRREDVLSLLGIKDPEPAAVRKEKLEAAAAEVDADMRFNVPGSLERALAMVTERVLFHAKPPQDDAKVLSLCQRLSLFRGRLADRREQEEKEIRESELRWRISGRARSLDWQQKKKPSGKGGL